MRELSLARMPLNEDAVRWWPASEEMNSERGGCENEGATVARTWE